MRMERKLLLLSGAAIVCLVVTVAFLANQGRHARVYGVAGLPGGTPVQVLTVDRPEQAYFIWKARGYRGRVVVGFSRWLNFVETDETRLILPTSPFPLQVNNLSVMAEKCLNKENFLFLALKSGIAREIVHVVPEADFANKSAAAVLMGVIQRHGRLEVPFMGSPRAITSPAFFRPPRESALIYVDASFFKENMPDELRQLLHRTGVRTDCVILCSSAGDREVSPRERERLMLFKGLLETVHDSN